jgi:antirestriction protein
MTIYSYDDLRGAEHIDSRDLIETADALREQYANSAPGGASDPKLAELVGTEPLTHEEMTLLAAIEDLETEGITDWEYGAQFIREDRFVDYAQDLADDLGFVAEGWPGSYIDWERAARDLAMDYTSVTFLGADYLVRS